MHILWPKVNNHYAMIESKGFHKRHKDKPQKQQDLHASPLPGSAKFLRGTSPITHPFWAKMWHAWSGFCSSWSSCSLDISSNGKVKYLHKNEHKTQSILSSNSSFSLLKHNRTLPCHQWVRPRDQSSSGTLGCQSFISYSSQNAVYSLKVNHQQIWFINSV